LKPLMTYHADLKPPVAVGAGPYGTRQIFEVTGGTFEGERLKGTILTGGGDWLLIDAKGVGHLDVRATFRTHDGAHVYMCYYGTLVVNDEVQKALGAGGETQYGDTEFFTAPRFETGDERYAWLNHVQAVAEGRVVRGAVEYRVYECVND
ncbi:MAG TPA: DUF3237 domain-containing protein, partial [Pseudomonadales bacterium]|nr:DUF3237 domain-containing protein [Pseudomonadales bacterium]